MRGVKLDERIVREFKLGVFVGLRRSNQGMHSAFFINGKETTPADLILLLAQLRSVPNHVRQAYQSLRTSGHKVKKKRRKKNAN
jgi:hypothetical protein